MECGLVLIGESLAKEGIMDEGESCTSPANIMLYAPRNGARQCVPCAAWHPRRRHTLKINTQCRCRWSDGSYQLWKERACRTKLNASATLDRSARRPVPALDQQFRLPLTGSGHDRSGKFGAIIEDIAAGALVVAAHSIENVGAGINELPAGISTTSNATPRQK